jgi:hypothetical protein
LLLIAFHAGQRCGKWFEIKMVHRELAGAKVEAVQVPPPSAQSLYALLNRKAVNRSC